MKTALLFLFLFKIVPVAAQYCCTEVGKVLYYTTVDKKEEKTLRDSALVRDVIRENERIVVDLRWYGDSYNSTQIMEGENKEVFIYRKKTGITDFIMLDAEVENTVVRLEYLSKYPEQDRVKAEKEYKEYSKYMYSEGRISIPIKGNAVMDEELPPCKYAQKIGFMSMSASLKGKYIGKEKVRTPAGDFDCIKIYTDSQVKFMLFSEKEYSMSWYAQGIGLVKKEIYTKRRKLLKSMTLDIIRKPGHN